MILAMILKKWGKCTDSLCNELKKSHFMLSYKCLNHLMGIDLHIVKFLAFFCLQFHVKKINSVKMSLKKLLTLWISLANVNWYSWETVNLINVEALDYFIKNVFKM